MGEGRDGVTVVPLCAARWDDFVELFTRPGPRGGPGPGTVGCWCMWWRHRRRPEENHARMEALVRSGGEPGLLAYTDGRPSGWVSVAPRASYGQLVRSRTYAPPDADEDVWSIACFYIHPLARHAGVAELLLERAVAHAFARGAAVVEAYPASVLARSDYMGSVPAYERLGFEPVREAGTRTVMRLRRPAKRRAT